MKKLLAGSAAVCAMTLVAPTAAVASHDAYTPPNPSTASIISLNSQDEVTDTPNNLDPVERKTPTIYLGDDRMSETVPVVFSPKDGGRVEGNTFTLIPGDTLHSDITVVNSGASEAKLTGYATDISVTTPTTLESDRWFREVLLKHSHTGSTSYNATSLYDLKRTVDNSTHGAKFFQISLAQDKQVDLTLELDFPIDSQAGNENVVRNFEFNMLFLMEDSRAPDTGDTDEDTGNTDGDTDSDDGNGNTDDGIPDNSGDTEFPDGMYIPDDSDDETIQDIDSSIDGDGTGNANGTEGDQEDNPDIISGFPGGDNGFAMLLIAFGIAAVTGSIFYLRKTRGTS